MLKCMQARVIKDSRPDPKSEPHLHAVQMACRVLLKPSPPSEADATTRDGTTSRSAARRNPFSAASADESAARAAGRSKATT